MILRKEGAHNVKYFKKKASTAFINGQACNVDANGFLQPGTNTSIQHVGVILRDVLSTDDDYAGITYVPVDMASPTDLFVADVSAGTAAQTNVGEYHDLNNTGDKVDLTAQTTKQVYIQEVLVASNQVVVIINTMAGVDETG